MKKEFEENSLLSFENYDFFIKFYKSLGLYKKWKISSGTMNSRGECIRDKKYSLILQNIFKDKNMFRHNVSIAEIVSWLDSFSFLSTLFDELKKELPEEIFIEISIYSEYVIRMSKKMRIDYVITYKEKILLVELRMVSSFNKIRPTWEKKKVELLIYRELIENYCPSNYKIISYALISLPEYDIKSKIDKHIEYNRNQVNFLKRYILEFLIY